MRYDISKASAPSMPKLGKGTKRIKIPPFYASKTDMKASFRYISLYFSLTLIVRKFYVPNSIR